MRGRGRRERGGRIGRGEEEGEEEDLFVCAIILLLVAVS